MRERILRTLRPENKKKLKLIALAKNKYEGEVLDELISGYPEKEYREIVRKKFGF